MSTILTTTLISPEPFPARADDHCPLSLFEFFRIARESGRKIVRSSDGSFSLERIAEDVVAPQLRSALVFH
jgi:hypothetical protein